MITLIPLTMCQPDAYSPTRLRPPLWISRAEFTRRFADYPAATMVEIDGQRRVLTTYCFGLDVRYMISGGRNG